MMHEEQSHLLSKITPDASLRDIQRYLRQVLHLRGFDGQTSQDKLLLLLEEVGELAKALRKDGGSVGVDHSKIANYTPVEEELADVFIVLISLCDVLGYDLFDAFFAKESENITRRWDA